MKKIFLALTALTVAFTACENAATGDNKKDSTGAAAKTDAAPEKELSQDEMMAKWMEYATPGEMHKMLAKDAGNWDYVMLSKMHPDSAEISEKGTSTVKMIMEGRYQQGDYKGTMMGAPFMGHAMTGYDNAKKKFVTTFLDNMGTGIMYMEGEWNDATKSIDFKGKMQDFTTGKEVDCRQVLKIIDDKTQEMEMYCTKTGKEEKMFTMKMMKKS